MADDGRQTIVEAAPLDEDARRAIQARASPEGIVAIMFTDVVQSTRIRQHMGDRPAQERFRQHNRIVREQIERHGGLEVKAQGDGFMVAFADVTAGVACAVGLQRAVARDNEQHPDQRIEVRIGLNAGQAIREEADFFGGTVVVAARLEALANAGEVLVSEAVRVLAGLPEGISYVRRGRRRLKGLEDRYEVWSVPWREEKERTKIQQLWARPAARIAALVVLALVVSGAVAAGVAMSRASGAIAYRELVLHGTTPEDSDVVDEITGNCDTEDLVVSPRTNDGPVKTADVSGDISGHWWHNFSSTVLFAADGCRTGFIRTGSFIRDAEGNELHINGAGPVSLITNSGVESYSLSASMVETISGGTGVYEGATGSGSCSLTAIGGTGAEQSGPSGRIHVESDCALLVTTDRRARKGARLVAGLGASDAKVAIFGTVSDVEPQIVSVLAAYWNPGDEPVTGLSLRLAQSDGAEVVTAAQTGDDRSAKSGERFWALPDLPSRGDLERFQFQVQVLSADSSTVSLVVEFDSDDLEEPVRTEQVTIQVVQ
jgi:class 3 adenylate cyclase